MGKKKFAIIFIVILAAYFTGISYLVGVNESIKLILTLLISYILCIIIHEIAHVFAGKLFGMTVNIIYLGPFTFIKQNKKWIIKFKAAYNDLFFGAVAGFKIPDVTTETELNEAAKKLRKVYLFAPIVNLVMGVILVPVFIKVYLWDKSLYLFVFLILSIGMGIAAFAGSDGTNSKKIRKNSSWAALILFINCMLYDGAEHKEDYSYLLMKVKESAKNISGMDLTDNKNLEDMYYNYIVLYYFLGDIIYLMPENVSKSIDFFTTQKDKFRKLKSSKDLIEDFLYLIIIYETIYEGKGKEAKDIYNFIQKNFYNADPLNYPKMRAQYFLGMLNNYDYLSQKDNMSKTYQGESFYKIELNILKLK